MNKILNFSALALFATYPSVSNAQVEITDAEQTYSYISSTLNTFRTTGRLVNNPGIDGSDLESFLGLLDNYFDQFSSEFNSESRVCEFYRDPENNKMTIEEKADISFSFLRDLEERIEHYIAVNEDFLEQLAEEFGTFLLDNINEIKENSNSYQRLPSSSLDEAAVISFLDSNCI